MRFVLAAAALLTGSLAFAQTPPAGDSGQAPAAAPAAPAAPAAEATPAAPAAEAKPAAPAPEAKAQPAAPQMAAPGTKLDQASSVAMLDVVPYNDVSVVPPEVLQECKELGKQLADSTEKSAIDGGFKVVRSASVDPAKGGQVLVLKIMTTISTRSMGAHAKTVGIRAEVYRDGKLVNTYNTSRSSGGGMYGTFKSSCAVLERTVNTLGSDVAKWMKNASAR